MAGVLVALAPSLPSFPGPSAISHTLHRFQPLAPRYANDSDEPPMLGFNRWVKTWTADYVSVQEIYWNVPGDDIDFNRLPRRAFDSQQQRELTSQLFAEYNRDHDLGPSSTRASASLAPTGFTPPRCAITCGCRRLRIADMWLRPRTELSSADPRWWEFNDDRRWIVLSLGFGAINIVYVLLGLAGTDPLPRIFWHRTIRFVSADPLSFFWEASKIPSLATLWNVIPRSSCWHLPVFTDLHNYSIDLKRKFSLNIRMTK